MATLRVDDQRRVAPGQAPGGFDAPDASRGSVAASRQMQAQGQAVEQAGQLAGSIYTAEREKVNEARVNDALNRAQRVAQEEQAEWSQLRGLGALEVGENRQPVTDVYAPRFERRIGEIADEMGLTVEQRRRYETQAQPLLTRYNGALTDHFITQNDAYQTDVDATTVATAQLAILATPDDHEALTEQMGRIAAATAATGRRMGWSAERVALEAQTRTGKAVLDVVQARIDQDPRGARDFADAHRDQMTAEQYDAARRATAQGLAPMEAAAGLAAFRASAPAEPGAPGASFQMPLQGVELPGPGSRDYGDRPRFRTSTGWSSSNHDGVDFSAPAGSPVRAVAGGRVVRAGVNGGYGNFVEIDHGNGVVTGYAHLQDFDVAEGDVVVPGQSFARVGSTGSSTGPHLHLRARRNGQSIDPAQLFSEEHNEGVTNPQPPGQPTRAQAEAWANQRYAGNPLMLNAARSEIARVYSTEAAAKAEQEQTALDTAYRHIETTRTPPTAAMMAALPPGRAEGIRNYFEAVTAPPVTRTDPSLELALAADLSWLDMSAEEFMAAYGSRLSTSDRVQYVSQLTRASTAAGTQVRQQAQSARVVPAEAFGRALNDALDLRGVDRTDLPDDERQQRALLVSSLRSAVLQAQQAKGSQLNEAELRVLISQRVQALAWERPGGWFSRPQDVVATSYDNMSRESIQAARDRLRRYGNANPTEAQIYENFVLDRVNRVR